MDLIAQLIQNKKNVNNVLETLSLLFDEIIKYEKLSKSPKFKNITESTVLQKQLPTIWSCFNGETQNMSAFEQAIAIVQNISDQPLQIFIDFNEHYSKRDRRNLTIIGNVNQTQYNFLEYSQLPATFDFDSNTLYLLNDAPNENEQYLVIVTGDNKVINIYTGLIGRTQKEVYAYKPYTFTENGKTLTLYTYSLLGNNDYPFAEIVDDITIPVRMPNSSSFKFGNQIYQMTPEQEAEYDMAKMNTKTFAPFIMKIYAEIN